MQKLKLLLLSNSTNAGQPYLEHALAHISDFLGKRVRNVLFLPYAAVTFSFDQYAAKVRERFEALGYALHSIHEMADVQRAVHDAEAVAVGGGNTFHLLSYLHTAGLLEPLRKRAYEGMPYIGWSAGSNVACPTIKTTNDMPIVQPPSFVALDLVPFQINPHYLDAHPEGHQGETREQRILEFVETNPEPYVVGLREGSLLRLEKGKLRLLGEKSARIFCKGRVPVEVSPAETLQFLLEKPAA